VHDPDGAPWEVYTVLADAPDAGDLTGTSRCRTVDGQWVPDAGDHGRAEPATNTAPAANSSPCCDTGTAASCCAPSEKTSCCGDTSAGLPSTCGCS